MLKKKSASKTAEQVYIAKEIEDLAIYRRVHCPVRQDAAGPKGPERLQTFDGSR